MTDTHIIPVLEPELHEQNENCACHPRKEINDEGKVVWIHINLMNDHLIERLNVF